MQYEKQPQESQTTNSQSDKPLMPQSASPHDAQSSRLPLSAEDRSQVLAEYQRYLNSPARLDQK